MKVLMIGGTGLLGSQAAKELLSRGHQVKTIALPGLPQGAEFPEEMEIIFGDINTMPDDELTRLMEGCEGFIFAAGVDERVEGKKPIYDMFHKYNIEPLQKILPLAKEVGIKHVVILGSYFSHFARTMYEYQMAKFHPYIKSRLDQEQVALSYADDDFHVSVLELPYIFGAQPGRKPVWTFLVELIQEMPGRTLYPSGGTAMVTVRQVGQAIAGALEKSRGAMTYPIGWFNLTWKEMLAIFHDAMGMPERKIITIPTFLFKLSTKSRKKKAEAKGLEGGLDLVEFAPVMASELFIDKDLASVRLGVTDDDIEEAIKDSVRVSLQALEKGNHLIEMEAE